MEAWTGRNFYRGGVELNKTILSGIRGSKHFKYKIHSIRRLEGMTRVTNLPFRGRGYINWGCQVKYLLCEHQSSVKINWHFATLVCGRNIHPISRLYLKRSYICDRGGSLKAEFKKTSVFYLVPDYQIRTESKHGRIISYVFPCGSAVFICCNVNQKQIWKRWRIDLNGRDIDKRCLIKVRLKTVKNVGRAQLKIHRSWFCRRSLKQDDWRLLYRPVDFQVRINVLGEINMRTCAL